MDGDTCPHCGSTDYGPVNEGHERACLSCGYDTEHGALGVCPGGFHPRDGGGPACPACLARLPRDVPGFARWRSQRRTLVARSRRSYIAMTRLHDLDFAVAIEVARLPTDLSTDR